MVEDAVIPLEGQGVVASPGLEERAEDHGDIHQDDEHRRSAAQDGERETHGLVGYEHAGAAGLAGERSGRLSLEHVLLDHEHGERAAEQDDRHGGSTLLVIGARDLQVDGGRERVDVTADHHGVGEVRHRLDHRNEECVAETREDERERDAREHLPARRAHVAGRLLEGRVDVLEQAAKHHVAHGEERHDLDDHDAPVPVDVVVPDAEERTGDKSRLAEEKNHREREDERRRDDREDRDDLEDAREDLCPELDVDLHVGEEQPDECRGEARCDADLHRVDEGPLERGHGEDALEDRERWSALREERVHQQNRQRIENEQRQEYDEEADGGDHDRVSHQLLPVELGALNGGHVLSPFLLGCRTS